MQTQKKTPQSSHLLLHCRNKLAPDFRILGTNHRTRSFFRKSKKSEEIGITLALPIESNIKDLSREFRSLETKRQNPQKFREEIERRPREKQPNTSSIENGKP